MVDPRRHDFYRSWGVPAKMDFFFEKKPYFSAACQKFAKMSTKKCSFFDPIFSLFLAWPGFLLVLLEWLAPKREIVIFGISKFFHFFQVNFGFSKMTFLRVRNIVAQFFCSFCKFSFREKKFFEPVFRAGLGILFFLIFFSSFGRFLGMPWTVSYVKKWGFCQNLVFLTKLTFLENGSIFLGKIWVFSVLDFFFQKWRFFEMSQKAGKNLPG